uniref:Protein TIC 214 n=1 Tax=Vicia bungei TaxID=153952 RepID=A0A6M4SP69_9FABA|nr:Ycf1 [Vicia bungei]
MIYNSILRDYLVGLCVKILNSAVVIGLYYGFLTTFSIGPSYLFLIRARVMEEGSETKISATTGFITGQLMMFISIYYAPLHLALSRPHTITVLTLPYLFLNYVHKNDKHYYFGSGSKLDSGYKNPNSIRNFRIYKVFFNNLFFQLLNPFLLPSSILIRLMNIYLFRSNNKLLFLTSSFVGWLIGHIFLMKCIGLVLVWLQQKNSIKYKITMRLDKYTLLQLRNYVGQIFVVFSFVLVAHYLGRTPLPYYYLEERMQYDDRDLEEVKAAIAAENEEEEDITVKDEEEEEEDLIGEEITVYLFEDIRDYLFGKKENEKKKKLAPLEKSLVTTLFDYQKWNRPLRYIKNDHFEGVVRDENSQFFFQTCQSDGKKRISFTYPPNLSTFLKIMEKKMDLFRREKTSYNDNELSNYWSSINKEKGNKLINEFFQRAKILDNKDKKFSFVDVFENRIRLSDDTEKTKYLTKIYDPFLNGRVRGEIQKRFSPFIPNETDNILINKIHGLLLSINSNDPQFEQKIDQFDRKLLLTEIGFFFNLISKFSEKSVSSLNFDGLYLFPEHEQVKIYSEEKKRKREFLLDAIRTDPTNNTIFNRKLCSEINEISKEVPRWSYNLVDELDVLMDANPKESQIRSPKADRIVLFSGKTDDNKKTAEAADKTTDNTSTAEAADKTTDNTSTAEAADKTTDNTSTAEAADKTTTNKSNAEAADKTTEFAITHYSREQDYCRDLIRGSMRAQRRKTVTYKLFQGSAHSPIFFEILGDYEVFFFGDLFYELSQYWKECFRKPGTDNSEFLQFEREMELKEIAENKDEAEDRLRQIEEAWESILYGLIIRSFVLLFQSNFRKYILLPSLIITKNIIRILLFQNPEWSEDFRDWRKEVHIYCTYQGIPVSHKELPTNWFWEGLQIRILYPFVLKPWHNKVRSTEKKKKSTEKKKDPRKEKNFWFLTGYGTQVESYVDDHVPNPFSFLGPILKKIKKKLKKDLKKYLKNRFLIVLKVFNERKKWFRIVLEEIENWNSKSILFRFKKRDELSESKKNSTISKSNPMIEESPVLIQSSNLTNYTEKRIKYLNVQTKTILKQLEEMTEEEKEGVITLEMNSTKTTSAATRLELLKKNLQIVKRRNVRFIRKSYIYFPMFLDRIYKEMVFAGIRILIRYLQRVRNIIELTHKIVNVFISIYKKKKNEQRVHKTNESIIPFTFMSIIDKYSNLRDMNSQNSCDVSSLSQAYVLFKLSQVSNGYKYKLRSIFESHGRSFFLKNEIKDYFFRIQGGRFNSKLRHKNRPDSRMNQWTNWLKVHYQYALPHSVWSRLVTQDWRNRIHKHRVAQNKDLVEYESSQKNQLIFYKKQQVDLLEKKKKIKKQYGYDLFSYQYINYADKKKSYIYGYKSPLQANKNQTISYNYNTPKNNKELFDIMGDSFIKNYIAKDGIKDIDMYINPDRKYLKLMGKRKKNSITNQKLLTPRFGFFSKLSEYKKNPWILPMNFFFVQFYGNKNITDKNDFKLEKEEYARQEDLKLYLSNYSRNTRSNLNRFRTDLKGERNFLLDKYFGVYLDCKTPVEERLMDNLNFYCLLVALKTININKFFILSIKKTDLDLETAVRLDSKNTCYTECRDREELRDNLLFFIEPIRISRKNYEQLFIYQIIRISLRHKRKILKRNYDLLVPENLLSTRRRRELRILISLNPRNQNTVHRNTINDNEKKRNNSSQVLTKKKDLDIDSDTKKLMYLKFFLWPNYRFEDLACMNRYWFDTHNGSRFSILRILMYPRLKI